MQARIFGLHYYSPTALLWQTKAPGDGGLVSLAICWSAPPLATGCRSVPLPAGI